MAIYLIVAKGNPPKVKAAIEAGKYPHHEFKPDTWFLKSDLTTNDLADSLGIREGPDATTGLAIPISSYGGRATSDVWEWLKSNWPTVT